MDDCVREEAEQRREFDPDVPPADRAKNGSLFFADLLNTKVREFVEHLRNRGKFFDIDGKRERDLILIDYDDPARNVFEVTEEWAFHNGHHGPQEDDLRPSQNLMAALNVRMNHV